MRAVCLIFFTLLLGGSSSSKFDTNHTSNEAASALINLETDVLYIILYKLEIYELVYTAEAFPELSSLIDEVFRRKYLKNQNLVRLRIADRSDRTIIGRSVFFGQSMLIEGFEGSIHMLERFGRFFQNIDIHYKTSNSSEVEIINRAINKYCSDSLKKLDVSFDVCNDYLPTLESFTTSFEGVEEFSITIPTSGLKVSKPLNELFPNLRRLNSKVDTVTNISFIDGIFPHLNYFFLKSYIYTGNAEGMGFMGPLKAMILKNPTIRSIEIQFDYPFNFLEFLSDSLPNLEDLRLDTLRITGAVQFPNVKTFIFEPHDRCYMDLKNLSLPKLRSIETRNVYSYLSQWIEFFKRHTHLKQLYIEDYFIFMNNEQSNRLVAALPDALDFTISKRMFCDLERIIQLARVCRKFEKFQFIFVAINKIPKTNITTLQQEFQDEWTVEAIEGIKGSIVEGYQRNVAVGLSFKRKQLMQEGAFQAWWLQ